MLLARLPLFFKNYFEQALHSKKEKPFDLHALSTPQAFILDQDQILLKIQHIFEKIS